MAHERVLPVIFVMLLLLGLAPPAHPVGRVGARGVLPERVAEDEAAPEAELGDAADRRAALEQLRQEVAQVGPVVVPVRGVRERRSGGCAWRF